MQYIHQYIVLGICLFFGQMVFAQYIVKGKVFDESNIGIPYADIYVKNYSDLRTRADIEGNYLMRLQVGEYYLVFSAMGYENREFYLVVEETTKELNMQLFPVRVKEL